VDGGGLDGGLGHVADDGDRHVSFFVGQWAPTFLIFGLYNKLVKQLAALTSGAAVVALVEIERERDHLVDLRTARGMRSTRG
jgi:hypothetical protein